MQDDELLQLNRERYVQYRPYQPVVKRLDSKWSNSAPSMLRSARPMLLRCNFGRSTRAENVARELLRAL